MSCAISKGLSKVCKDSKGGISKVYLFPYVKYNRSSIKVNNLVLSEFPATQIFEFSAVLNSNLDQKMTDEDGGKYYTQSISLQFQGIKDKFTFQKLLKKDYRLIIKDNNGNLRLLGAYNGLECESLDVDAGSSKNSFSGLTVSFNGKEINEALFVKDLSDAGFTI